ncbi:MAG: TIR domain-containing protein [Ruminiclostridium sp.]
MADVFISHSSKDKEIAEIICNSLEAQGIKCWIAPRDIRGGEDWSAAITDAIRNSKVFIVVFSKNSAQSTQVPREIALADKTHSRIIPYKIDDTELSDSFEYYLTTNHWVNASAAAGNYNVDGLVAAVTSALGIESSANVTVNNVVINMASINQSFVSSGQSAPVQQPASSPVQQPAQQPAPVSAAPAKKTISKKTALIIEISVAFVLIAAAVLWGIILMGNKNGQDSAESDNSANSESTAVVATVKNTETDTETGADNLNPEDIIYSPADFEPYENYQAKIFSGNGESFTVLGEQLDTGIMLNAGQGSYILYYNQGGFDKLRFTLARVDNTSRGKNTVRVFLDGEEQKLISTDSDYMPTDFEYDISGVKQIKIAIDQHFIVSADYVLYDISMSRGSTAPKEEQQSTAANDIARSPVDKQPYEVCDAKILANDKNDSFMVLRESYNNGILLKGNQESYVIFDNKEEYEKLSFTLCRVDNTARGDVRVRVYLDGVEQKVIETDENYMPEDFEYDIKGVKQIKIAVERNVLVGAELLLTDIYFTKNGAEPEKQAKEINAPDLANAPAEKPPYEVCDARVLADDKNDSFTVLLKDYNNGIVLKGNQESYVIFDNNEEYEKLLFTLGRVDNTPRGTNRVKVYLDGAEQKVIETDENYMPEDFEYDIKGVKQIKIAVERNVLVGAELLLTDIYFTKNGAEPEKQAKEINAPDLANAPAEKPPYVIADCKVFANDPNFSVTASGKTYDSGIVFYTKSEPKVIFHNKEDYNKLSFKISKVDGAPEGENRAFVYIDGVPQQEINLDGAPFLAEYEYDISGSSQIIILAEHSIHSSGEILVTDIVFSK